MLRGAARALLALVALVVLAAVGVVLRGWWLLHAPHPQASAAIAAATDSASLARGEHLARISCAGCHSPDLSTPLSGGRENFLKVPGGPTFGSMQAPNLTPGGVLAHATDAELARAIREGIGRDGHALLVMPSAQLRRLSDDDLACLLGYLRSQPKLDSARTARAPNALGYAVLGLGLFPTSAQPPVRGPVPSPPRGIDPEHGEYLVSLLACRDCHGPDLKGGRKGQFPPIGPDLTALCAAHPLESFDRALRDGISATTGRSLDPTRMPFPVFNALASDEVGAIYAYLKDSGTPP